MMLNKKVNQGFTVIELLVVISIIAVVSIFVLINYRSSQKKYTLEQATQKLISDIRRVQNMALGSFEFNGSIPAGGWGVYFSNWGDDEVKRYIVYADALNPCTHCYDGPFGPAYPPSPELYEVVFLPKGVTVSGLESMPIGLPLQPKNEIEVTFSPPDPDTYLRADGDFDNSEVQITLTNSAQSRIVTVTNQGVID